MPDPVRRFDVRMPALGESVTDGTINRWLKHVGDTVGIDDPLLEVSTDKIDTEIPSPAAGTLLEITAQEDDTVDVGALIAVIGDPVAALDPEPVTPDSPRGSTLVVDFGTTTMSAAIVTGDVVRLIKEPATGSWSWPSAVCLDGTKVLVGTLAENVKRVDPAAFRDEIKRDLGTTAPVLLGDKAFRPVELVAEMLAVIRRQAEREAGHPLERAVLTVPATYGLLDPRWSEMIEAGERAGFAEVELLPEPAAAALAPLVGPPVPAGATVLIYDFGGGTFDCAVVRDGTVLGCGALDDCGGRDIDALLASRTVQLGGPRLTEQLTPADDHPDAVLDAQHVRMDLTEFVRRTKHHLTDASVARDYLRAARHRIEMEQTELTALVAPLLERTVGCCRDLLGRLAIAPDDLAAVVLVGGSSRMPAVAGHLERALGRPLRQSDDLPLAVVTGASEWVRRRDPQAIKPSGPGPQHRPICWDFPGGTATLVRWLVERGVPLTSGTEVAVVRSAGGALLRLAAGEGSGTVTHLHAHPGEIVASGDWLVTLGYASAAAALPNPLGSA